MEFIFNKMRDKFNLSFVQQLVIRCIVLFLLMLTAFLFVINSIDKNRKYTLTYKETGNIDYKVYLKPNDFYDQPYLEEGMTYIATLIDHIDIDFNYLLNAGAPFNANYNYSIMAKLVITPEGDESKVLFTKEYTLKDNIQKEVKELDLYQIQDKITLDYNYYNNLAESFKTAFDITCDSNLFIYLKVDTQGEEIANEAAFSNSREMAMKLPLTLKQVDINIESDNLDESHEVIKDKGDAIGNKLLFVVGILFLLMAILEGVIIGRMLALIAPRKDRFAKYVQKILVDYDRTIVEADVMPNLKEYEIVKTKKFSELLDVRDNLKVPIVYVPIHKQKCCFYIKHFKTLYVHYVKAIDLEEGK